MELVIRVETEQLRQSAEQLRVLIHRLEEVSQTLYDSGNQLKWETPVEQEAEILRNSSRSVAYRADELSALSQILSAVSEAYDETEYRLTEATVSGAGIPAFRDGVIGAVGYLENENRRVIVNMGSGPDPSSIPAEEIHDAVEKTIFPLLDGMEEGENV